MACTYGYLYTAASAGCSDTSKDRQNLFWRSCEVRCTSLSRVGMLYRISRKLGAFSRRPGVYVLKVQSVIKKNTGSLNSLRSNFRLGRNLGSLIEYRHRVVSSSSFTLGKIRNLKSIMYIRDLKKNLIIIIRISATKYWCRKTAPREFF